MKKLLLSSFLIAITSASFASGFGSLTNAANNPDTMKCMNSCDAGVLLKSIGKNDSDAGKLSKTACNVACVDSCFSGQLVSGTKTEEAAIACKDSLNKTFSAK